jgi:hypothetical protein
VIAFVAVVLVLAACSTATAPSSPAAPEPPASEAATPEPTPATTPDPTAEAEPSEEVGACMDPDTYELLIGDYQQWTAEDMSTLAAALEAYDFSGFEPAVREYAEKAVDEFAAGLRRGELVGDPAGFRIRVQAGEIPILPCD